MPLRNFGLSFSRRAHAGVTWRPSSKHGPVVAGPAARPDAARGAGRDTGGIAAFIPAVSFS
jgi:hypothetical protein